VPRDGYAQFEMHSANLPDTDHDFRKRNDGIVIDGKLFIQRPVSEIISRRELRRGCRRGGF